MEKTKNSPGDSQQSEGVLKVSFPWGMPGLEYKHYLLSPLNQDSPFFFLQSVEEPLVGLLLINPFALCRDYEFDISDETAELLKISKENEVAVFCTVNTGKGLESATVNFLAPIIINTRQLVGKQVVLHDQKYSFREPLNLKESTRKEGE